MALGIFEQEDIRAIADAIRNTQHGGSDMTTKQMPKAIEDALGRAYADGETDGNISGYESGYEEGKTDGFDEVDLILATVAQGGAF